ncbi:type VI secretion system baseplate subunit TssK [Pseudoalteromonas sp. SG43-7]|uniref:Type VI secretion system baseplate subunit TssK n=1 Tax=Pseudoalteromonas rhizosphaerae TaxID=2518973 RepID=A0ABW8L278_9GAMM|nr:MULTISPECIES: type VI secretion system baseplate subunit TssK [unclassified Pseudoalteromonas]MBB1335279.1 type VI secretion system baseplate subunit TssK [Pseudoalteromonas sp. SR41-6]MBB1343539.1 type VI secretion system baseplate subunit TssK [Pseudoalteromonas sp. SR45-6]MBB1419127.1 type VI secretion system baseplate subunit TssK [Pseudoalteromonas sp. SG44-1]MBB1423833.1 type VI secretion system baseplate subunit TssK [Pseudoalteromonas sp. SG43-7]MBB1436325.1 type VI secretion system|tara:strand:- start:26590 stop:27930 length:1341 start_codon:yes stop_codon:yes gene_type:complete
MSTKAPVKPVWAEGVLLAQHHFQLFDEYHEQNQIVRQRLISPLVFGIQHLAIDESALSRGLLKITSFKLLLENGRLLDFDRQQHDELKLELDPNLDEVIIYIAIAANKIVSNIEGYATTGQLSAYHADYIELNDDHDAARNREVLIAHPKFILLTDSDVKTYFDTLACLKIVRAEDGSFVVNKHFVPPLLNISASVYLTELLNRTANLVNAKVNVLLSRRKNFGSVTDFGPNEMNSFLLLNAMAPSAKRLDHLKSLSLVHPERLYCELVDLISSVSMFEHSDLVNQVPPYQHKQLSHVFGKLDELLTKLLEGVVPKKMAGLKLEKVSNAIHQVATIDSAIFEHNDFYLAVYFEAEDTKWIETFSDQVKVGATEKLDIMISSALAGVQLTHCQRPPNKLAIKSGYEYFRLESHGYIWQQIIEEQSLSLFIPFGLQAAQIEIVTVARN